MQPLRTAAGCRKPPDSSRRRPRPRLVLARRPPALRRSPIPERRLTLPPCALLPPPTQIPVYIWAPEEEGQFQPGRCSRWWLAASLASLDAELRARGSRLLAYRAPDSKALLCQLAAAHGCGAVLFNHLYDPISMVRRMRGCGHGVVKPAASRSLRRSRHC